MYLFPHLEKEECTYLSAVETEKLNFLSYTEPSARSTIVMPVINKSQLTYCSIDNVS